MRLVWPTTRTIVLLAVLAVVHVGTDSPIALAAPDLQLPWPGGVQHRIFGGNTYGCDTHSVPERNYYGIDFVFGSNDHVAAVTAGTVVDGENAWQVGDDGRGNFLEIDHGGGYRSRYLHLSLSTPWAPGIGIGSAVSQGQLIGYAGGTGGVPVHLHFDMQFYDAQGSHAHRAEPMSGYTGFGFYGYSVESGIGQAGCSNNLNDPSPYYTSQAPCSVPPGGVANGGLYRGSTEGTVYITYDSTKYSFSSGTDFEAMGTTQGFWWDDIICVPNGYMNGIGDTPPDKSMLREHQDTGVYVYLRSLCNARFWVPNPPMRDLMISQGYSGPERVVPRYRATQWNYIPDAGCHLGQHGSGGQYVTCSGPPPYVYSKWLVWHPDVLGWMGLSDSTLRWLWTGALDGVPNILVGQLKNSCPQGDADTWSGQSEKFIGTKGSAICSLTTTHNDEKSPPVTDAWPPDFNDTRRVDLSDQGLLGSHWNAHHPDALYSRRFDLNTDALNNLADLGLIGPHYNHGCTSPGP